MDLKLEVEQEQRVLLLSSLSPWGGRNVVHVVCTWCTRGVHVVCEGGSGNFPNVGGE